MPELPDADTPGPDPLEDRAPELVEHFLERVDWPEPRELPGGREPVDHHRSPLDDPDDAQWLDPDDPRRPFDFKSRES